MARPRRFITMARHASAALLAAIEIYNKAVFPHKEHTLAFLLVNAWEILIKARIIQQDGRLAAIYLRNGRRYRRHHLTNEPLTISIGRALNRIALPESVKLNIEGLVAIRDKAVHLGSLSDDVQTQVLYYATASVQNFIRLTNEWFDEKVEVPYLLPVGFVGEARLSTEGAGVGQRRLLAILEQLASSAGQDQEYAVTIQVEINLTPRFTGGGTIGVTNDPSAPKLQISDTEELEMYPYTYADICAECKERYPDFKRNKRFNTIMRSINQDPECTYERKLDPRGKGGVGKRFYGPQALAKLDAQYRA